VVVSGRPLQPSLLFAGKVRSLPKLSTFELFDSRGKLWPYPQTRDLPERDIITKHSSLLRKFVNYGRKKLITLGPDRVNFPIWATYLKPWQIIGGTDQTETP
jgi:hypothetical protein